MSDKMQIDYYLSLYEQLHGTKEVPFDLEKLTTEELEQMTLDLVMQIQARDKLSSSRQ